MGKSLRTRIESYAFYRRGPSGDIPLSLGLPGGELLFPPPDVEIPWPMEIGKTWAIEDLALTIPIGPDIESNAIYDYQFAVDAWGTITVPGGTFECLRVHQTGSGK